MAEYFPLLDRAVSGLADPTAEARRSIYDRARVALLGQLRGMDPPVPDDDIAREGTALDEAIARVEAKFADHKTLPAKAPPAQLSPPAQMVPPRPAARPQDAAPPGPAPEPSRQEPAPARPVPNRDVPPDATTSGRPAPPAAGSLPGQVRPLAMPPMAVPPGAVPPVVPPLRERPVLSPRFAAAGDDVVTSRPAVVPRPSTLSDNAGSQASFPIDPGQTATPLPGLPTAGGLPGGRGTRPVMALRPAAAAATAAAVAADAAPGVAADVMPPVASGSAAQGITELERTAEPATAPDDTVADDAAGQAETTRTARGRDGTLRPPAPRPPAPSRLGWPMMLVAGIAALLMIGVGIAAWILRDKPEQVVATRSAPETSTDAASGKIIDRAGSAASDPSTSDAAADATSGAATAAIPQNGGGDDAAGIAVAQRAALLVDAPEEPQRIKTYTGTVVWHVDSVSSGQGQPLSNAVKADIDIPDAKLKVTMLLQRNPEPQLPASHTIEFHFLPQPGTTLGNVKQVNVPEMRKDDDAPTGDPLTGVPVAITDNYFLVGLSRGAAEAQNLRLITERNWIDVSVLFTSGKLGKLTFEKGAAGQRIVQDALNSWKDNH